MSQVMDVKMIESNTAWAKGNSEASGEKEPLIPFDEEYPTFGRQPDFRYFAMPEHVNVSDGFNFVK